MNEKLAKLDKMVVEESKETIQEVEGANKEENPAGSDKKEEDSKQREKAVEEAQGKVSEPAEESK